MSEPIRSFAAVDVPEPVRAQIGRLLDRLNQGPTPKVRWVKPAVMHLTLEFLGEVSGDFIESAKAQLSRVVPKFKPFEAQLSGLGAFPSPSRARVIWVGVEGGKEELCRLQASMTQALVRIGFKPERRPFSPHLTLGRLNVPADVSAATAVEFQGDVFAVNEVVLFQSVLTPQGPVYMRLATFPLGGDGATA